MKTIRCQILVALIAVMFSSDICSAENSVDETMAQYQAGNCTRVSLRKLMFAGALDALLHSSQGDIYGYLSKNPGRLDHSAETYIAMRLINEGVTDNGQYLFLYGLLYNNARMFSSPRSKFILLDYYQGLAPELEDSDIFVRMRKSGWNIDAPLFECVTKFYRKTGKSPRNYSKPWIP